MGPCLQNAQLAGYPNELPYKLLEFVHFRLWLCVCCDFNPQLRAFGALTSAFKLKLWSFAQKGCPGKKTDGSPVLKDGAAMRAGHVKSKAPCLGRECLADGGTENCVSIGFPNRHENFQNLGQLDNVDLISLGNPS